jgi:hypothetical protein
MSIRDHSAQEIIERTPWWLVACIIAAITVVFGAAYHFLTFHMPGNGLKAALGEEISIQTCVYFSIVTESTLGDGNITPHGIARAIVSIQVLVGLMIAGVLVAKIVSAPSGAAARILAMAEGDWVDCVVPEASDRRYLGRTWIQGERNGLSFQGMDHLDDGTPADTFVAHSLALGNNKVRFTYQSFDQTKSKLSSGVTTLTFSADKNNRRYNKYSITFRDSTGVIYSGMGMRLSETGLESQMRSREECTPDSIKALALLFDRQGMQQ